jgi:fucose 4-O-acetylase-like acetyltransferase
MTEIEQVPDIKKLQNIAAVRDPYFDNVKGILIFLVVFGHVIQKYIHNTMSYIYIPFIIIYCFHMPLFIFLSGYFSKNVRKTQEKAFERFLLPYIVWALVYFIIITVTRWKSDFNFAVPWFAYWYFPSLFTLCLFLPILTTIRLSLPILFVLPLIIGFFPDYSWAFSLSRTICFAPFFLLGYYCNENTLKTIQKNKIPILIAALLVFGALILLCLSPLVQENIGKVEHSLWMAEPYRASRVSGGTGVIYRAIIMAAALVFGAFVLAFAPHKKSILTLIGKNSLVIFVFHGYFVQYLNDFFTFNPAVFSGVAILILISIGITLLLSINLFYRAYNRFMGIIQKLIFKIKPEV